MRAVLRVVCAIIALACASLASVTVSSPTAGSSVSSSVHVVATSSSAHVVTAMAVYFDSVLKYKVGAANVDTYISTSVGSHYVVIQSWDSTGYVQKQALTIQVTSSGSPVPSNATYYSNIDQMTGWSSCDACAGQGGAGPSASYSMSANQSSPSLDGKSAVFFLGGSSPYSSALWWRQLGGNSSVSHFVYDLYFYLKNPAASQALEFDVNQSLNGKKFIFGTQCDYRDHKDWDVWDTANGVWVKTGIGCTTPQAYTWNHLVLEFERTSTGKALFVAVTLNGKKSYINRSYYPKSANAYELNTAFQMDGNGTMVDYSTWVDKMQLIAW